MIEIFTVLFGMFCAAMEALITATLLPSMISSLGEMHLYPWVINSFGLTFILAVPFFGKLCDAYSYKKVYFAAVSIFIVGSLLCGFATSMPQLIFFRAIQGIGSGGLITLGVAYFGFFPIEKRAKMQAMVSFVWAFASIIGPVIGATLAEAFSWRWAFFMNVPAGLLVMSLMALFVKPIQKEKQRALLDIKGGIVFALGMMALFYALISIGKLQFSFVQIASAVVGTAFLSYFIKYSLETPNPFIPISMLKNRFILIAVMLGFMAGFFIFCVANFLPLFVQGVLGQSAMTSGKVIVAMAFGSVVGASISGGFLNRLGFQSIALIGAVLLVIGFALFSRINSYASLSDLAIACFLVGAGVSAMANCGIIAVQASTPKALTGSATSLFQFSRSLGSNIGIAVMGGLQLGQFRRGIELAIDDPTIAQLAETPQRIFNAATHAVLPAQQVQAFKDVLAHSIQDVFLGCLLIALLAVGVAIRMSSKKPKEFAEIANPILSEIPNPILPMK